MGNNIQIIKPKLDDLIDGAIKMGKSKIIYQLLTMQQNTKLPIEIKITDLLNRSIENDSPDLIKSILPFIEITENFDEEFKKLKDKEFKKLEDDAWDKHPQAFKALTQWHQSYRTLHGIHKKIKIGKDEENESPLLLPEIIQNILAFSSNIQLPLP